MRVGILGAGESGIGAALLAKKKKYEIIVSDGRQIRADFRDELIKNDIPFEEGGHDIDRLKRCDLIVKSPGIPDKVQVITELLKTGVPVISEIEFGYRHTDGRIAGITGSNGKTTTTRLVHWLLRSALDGVVMAGNVGKSFCRSLSEGDAAWWVLELSSFQLDGISTFRPDVAILLNITPDHLDRYEGQMQLYAEAKMRIALNMRDEDLFIYNADDGVIRRALSKRLLTCDTLAVDGSWMPDEGLVEVAGKTYRLPQEVLPGKHNQLNAACAIAAAVHAGVDREEIKGALETFRNSPHRLERVTETGHVLFVNDSKATNVDSVLVALKAFNRPIIWIAGGQDKGNNYTPLKEVVKDKVKALICLGVDNAKIKEAFSTEVEKIMETTHATEAVRMAASVASPGDCVLLSPACASFDLFNNYEHRGNAFKDAVMELAQNKI